MSIEEIEREIHDAYLRLAESATLVRHCHEHYLDDLAAAGAAHDQATGDLPGTITMLTEANPWALADFGDPRWDFYTPDLKAPSPAGIRVGALAVAGGAASRRCRRWPGSPGRATC